MLPFVNFIWVLVQLYWNWNMHEWQTFCCLIFAIRACFTNSSFINCMYNLNACCTTIAHISKMCTKLKIKGKFVTTFGVSGISITKLFSKVRQLFLKTTWKMACVQKWKVWNAIWIRKEKIWKVFYVLSKYNLMHIITSNARPLKCALCCHSSLSRIIFKLFVKSMYRKSIMHKISRA